MARTREQQREYMRQYRASKRGVTEAVTQNVTSLGSKRFKSDEVKIYESVEDAVRAEIKTLSSAADRPADVSAALQLARILDDPRAANRVQAAVNLRTVMDALRGGGGRAVNRLSNLRDRRGSAG